jgi:hypothetical protein
MFGIAHGAYLEKDLNTKGLRTSITAHHPSPVLVDLLSFFVLVLPFFLQRLTNPAGICAPVAACSVAVSLEVWVLEASRFFLRGLAECLRRR